MSGVDSDAQQTETTGAAARRTTPRDYAAQGGSRAFQACYSWLSGVREFLGALRVVIVPLGVSIAAALFLFVPEQTKELYRYLFESFLISLVEDVNSLAQFAQMPLIFENAISVAAVTGEPIQYTLPPEIRVTIYIQVALAVLGVALVARALRNAAEHAIGRLDFLTWGMGNGPRAFLIVTPYLVGLLPILAGVAGVWRALEGDKEQSKAATLFLDQLPSVPPEIGTLTQAGEFLVSGVYAILLVGMALIGGVVGVWWLLRDHLGRTSVFHRVEAEAAAAAPAPEQRNGFVALALCLSLYVFAAWLFGPIGALSDTIHGALFGGDLGAVRDARMIAWICTLVLPLVAAFALAISIVSQSLRTAALGAFMSAGFAMVFGWIALFAWPPIDAVLAGDNLPGGWPLFLVLLAIAVVTLANPAAQHSRSYAISRSNAVAIIGTPIGLYVLAAIASTTLGVDNDIAIGALLALLGLSGVAFVVSIFWRRSRPYVFHTARGFVLLALVVSLGYLVSEVGTSQGVFLSIMTVFVLSVLYLLALSVGLLIGMPASLREVTKSARAAMSRAMSRPVDDAPQFAPRKAAWNFRQRIAFYVVFVAAIALVVAFRVELPQTVGALALFAVFICILALFLTQLSIWGARLGVPLITFFLLGAVLFSTFNLNDNHQVRRVDADGALTTLDAVGERTPVLSDLCKGGAPFDGGAECRADTAFEQWLENRADRQAYEDAGKSYPVFIVAAQGGGIYAAAHTVEFLTKAQALCPRFAQHLFAISGVSGGSVGASIYASLAKHYSRNLTAADSECPLKLDTIDPSNVDAPLDAFVAAEAGGDELERAQLMFYLGREAVAQDFLSPLFGAALFPDFLQRFLPYPVPELSRARALEEAFEGSWRSAHQAMGVEPPARGDASGAEDRAANPLSEGFLQLWDPRGVAPALILNSTEAGSGRRRAVAPFVFGAEGTDLRLLPIRRGYDVPLSTAASLSARFPWLTPAGWFWDDVTRDPNPGVHEKRQIRLVDGGYYENSGVATAIELIQELQNAGYKKSGSVDIQLIVLTRGGYVEVSGGALGEALSPIRAMLGTRAARTQVEIARAAQEIAASTQVARLTSVLGFDRSRPPNFLGDVRKVPIDSFYTPLPLGWTLSRYSIDQIGVMAGHPDSCVDQKFFERQGRDIPASLLNNPIVSASCAQRAIYQRLSAPSQKQAEPVAHFGELTLSRNFAPDPSTIRFDAGGETPASEVYAGCAGFVSAQPDLTLRFEGGPLAISAQPSSAESTSDLVLIVREPDGKYSCSDDYSNTTTGEIELHPGLTWAEAPAGAYQIWVGDIVPQLRTQVALRFSRAGAPVFDENDRNLGRAVELGPVDKLDPTAAPEYGSLRMKGDGAVGSVDITAGGGGYFETVLEDQTACFGYTAGAPDLHIDFEGDRLSVWAKAEADIAMIIEGPTGEQRCNDDYDGLNPGLELTDAADGVYSIWIVTLAPEEAAATVTVSNESAPFFADQFDADAQLALSGQPAHGVIRLSPDPNAPPESARVELGGDIDARDLGVDGCFGWVDRDPDLAVSYGGGPISVTASARTDATLMVLSPDGVWSCGDDSLGLDAVAGFIEGVSGEYRIWVGSYAGDRATATVTVSTDELVGVLEETTALADATIRLNPDGEPTYGHREIRGSIGSEPILAWLHAGGPIDASHLSTSDGGSCWGWIETEPDLALTFEGGPMSIEARSAQDTTLVIRDPSGNWICNDDFDDVNPAVAWASAPAGLYRIWVGAYGTGKNLPAAMVSVSEPNVPKVAAPPEHGALVLRPGVDSVSAEVEAGGAMRALLLGQQCVGAIGATPDVTVQHDGGRLAISALSEADTTIAVFEPSGRWSCNDDAVGLSAGVAWPDAEPGEYKVFVGLLSEGDRASATVVAERKGEIEDIQPELNPGIELTPDAPPAQSVELGAEPVRLEAVAGGVYNAVEIAAECFGWISLGPTLEVTTLGGPMSISAQAEGDITLVMRGPDGSWTCNDDFRDLNPGIAAPDVAPGVYKLWVGSYADQTHPATVIVAPTAEPQFDEQ